MERTTDTRVNADVYVIVDSYTMLRQQTSDLFLFIELVKVGRAVGSFGYSIWFTPVRVLITVRDILCIFSHGSRE